MSRVKVPTLETERLVLRGWKRRDAAALYAYAKNPNVGPHAGWKPHADVHESRTIITQMFQQNTTWAITPKEGMLVPRGASDGPGALSGPADVPIGSIGFETDAYRPNINSREMGYSLSRAFWGRGIMTEAARRLLAYGFEELDLSSVMIRTGEANERSQRVISKCGFRYEGTLRQCYRMYDGQIRDSRVYSMLRGEYQELYGGKDMA